MPSDHEPSLQRKRAKLSYVYLSILSAILLAGALFRLCQLGAASLWQDEAHTLWLSQLPWNQMIDALLKLGVHPPLHFSLVKVITSLPLNGEASLRILSTLADLGAMAIVVWLGYRIAGAVGSLAAGWYWAFHPMAIWYAREGRPYALALLFSTIVVASYFRLREGHSRLAWAVAIFSLVLGMMTHYFVLLVAAGLVLLSFFDRRQRLAFRRWTLAFLASLIPLALWLASYFQQPEISLGIGWIDRPTLSDLAGTIWNLLSGYAGVLRAPSTIAGILVLVFVLAALLRKENRRIAWIMLSSCILLPLVSIWTLSQFRPIYMDRYFIVLVPYVAVLVAMGAKSVEMAMRNIGEWTASLQFRSLIVIGLAAIGIWTAFQVHIQTAYTKEDWRGLAAYLSEHADRSDHIWFTDSESQVALQFYTDELILLEGEEPSVGSPSYWFVARQPYTATHAYSQAVSEADRPWNPEPATICQPTDRWESASGLLLLHMLCEGSLQ